MLFKLKRGTHYDRNGKVCKKGDIVESSRDLVAVFSKEKFERDFVAEQKAGVVTVSKPNIPPPVDKDEDRIEDEVEDDVEETKSESLSTYGKDVTSKFPTAEKVEVSVFEKSKWYTIVDKADGEVLNEKKLRKKEVKPFLEQYLDEGADDDDEE